jgi:hypothetical protein
MAKVAEQIFQSKLQALRCRVSVVLLRALQGLPIGETFSTCAKLSQRSSLMMLQCSMTQIYSVSGGLQARFAALQQI